MKKGFTLIELLAVIVILAIIALIAVPIVLHIIDDSKSSSEEQTIQLYIDSVKKAIARKQLEESNFNPDTCNIKDDGNLLCNDIEVIVDMKGTKPNKGIIEIKDNKVAYKNLLLNGNYYNKITELVLDNNNNGKPDIGDKYTYKVNDTDTFNFYVLSINSDNTVNLIMDRNICNDGTTEYTSENNYCMYKWLDGNNNAYGPVTAMQELYAGTKEWINVENLNFEYLDEGNQENSSNGYNGIVSTNGIAIITNRELTENTLIGTSIYPLKARLPKFSEVREAGCTVGAGSCPTWLIENMTYYNVSNDKYSINNNDEVYQNQIEAYLTMSATPNHPARVRIIYYTGGINSNYTIGSKHGVRPVITVPKDYLE